MSFNPLSLSPIGIIDLTLSPASSPPGDIVHSPSDYIPSNPVVLPALRRREPRRCSCCRELGHDARTCPQASGVHFQGQIYNRYNNPRDNLTQFVYSRILQRTPQMNAFPRLLERLFEDIAFHVLDLSFRELKVALKNPMPIITFAYTQLILRIEQRSVAQQPILGADHAKNIEVLFKEEDKEPVECFICCNQLCSVVTSCGHEFCVDCVMSIINTNKAKTSPAVCSFCKAPFTQLTTKSSLSHTTLTDFIKNLA